MNKIKIFVVAILGLFASTSTYAQLLTRENVDARLIQGTRPVAGNFGFTVGAGLIEIQEMIDDDVDLRGLPLMNFNYYFTDNIEFTLGTQIYNLKKKSEGKLLEGTGNEVYNESENFLRFMPGANYHLDQSNFWDTYGGANIILGNKSEKHEIRDRLNESGDYSAESMKMSSFVWGFDLHFGIRKFIADLPLAISVEAGILGEKDSNTQYEYKTESSIGGVVTSQEFYTREADSEGVFSELEQSEWEIGANLRFGLTYFFRR
ncbi:hypothetical protein [Reichenbachiella versicolor]|uniref:hypothetical protein n=1 Tax=Reichenbachiella versicolor TaxID=1821036 RepID=UPI000D6E2355|nr:hypothetical protein [Reichenbachiella versicolor]